MFQPSQVNYPFLLGTTSYIIPDEIIPNVKMLAPLVDDIELVLFESDSIANIPSNAQVNELRQIAQDNNSGFTVHLPTDRKAASHHTGERIGFCDCARRIIDRTRPLSPRAWVLHLEGIHIGATAQEIAQWQERCKETVAALTDAAGDPQLVAIENLSYPFVWNMPVVEQYGTALCLDIGHLWVQQDDSWESICRGALKRTSVIHFHGVHHKDDHLSLRKGDLQLHETFVSLLIDASYSGVITLEVFNGTDFYESMEVIKELWEKSY